jgi:hypothetical protein
MKKDDRMAAPFCSTFQKIITFKEINSGNFPV